ncbi:MAG: hypothetical protein V3V22_08365 [Methylococcales bacterium]
MYALIRKLQRWGTLLSSLQRRFPYLALHEKSLTLNAKIRYMESILSIVNNDELIWHFFKSSHAQQQVMQSDG